MRIAHVTDCYLPRIGGIERQVHQLALRQSQLGHDVEVITSVVDTSITDVGGLVVHRPAGNDDAPLGAISYGASSAGRDIAVHGGYDVVHLHASTWSPLTYLSASACARAGIPTVVTVHSLWSYAAPLFRLADATVRWSDWPIRWSAVSSVAALSLQRTLGASNEVAILPNGVEPSEWRCEDLPREAKRVVVATVGRLVARKRPRQLLRMLRLARAAIPANITVEAVVVGDGPMRESLQRYLNRNQMSDWVQLRGTASQEDIRALYRDVDLYVAPATLESFGIAALEARCAGLPVLARAGSGVADFIGHEREGMLAGNDREMMSMITALATSPERRGHIRRHNLATTPPSSWADTIELSGRLYEDAQQLASRRRPVGHSESVLT
jgi:glycosyltransferase involved in cell wall biosynthesis